LILFLLTVVVYYVYVSQKNAARTSAELTEKPRNLNERFNPMGKGRQLTPRLQPHESVPHTSSHHRQMKRPLLKAPPDVKFARYDIALQAPRKSEKVVITLLSDSEYLDSYRAQKATLECYARRYNYEFLVLNPLDIENATEHFFFLKHRAVAEAMAQHPEYQVFVCSPFFFTFLFISFLMWLV
jgi:hypothetical protein